MDLFSSTGTDLSKYQELDLSIEEIFFEDFYEEDWEIERTEQELVDDAKQCIQQYKEKVANGFKDMTIIDCLKSVTVNYSAAKTDDSTFYEVNNHLFDMFSQFDYDYIQAKKKKIDTLENQLKNTKDKHEVTAIKRQIKAQRQINQKEDQVHKEWKKSFGSYTAINNRHQIEQHIELGRDLRIKHFKRKQQLINLQAKLKEKQIIEDNLERDDNMDLDVKLDFIKLKRNVGKDINQQKLIKSMNEELYSEKFSFNLQEESNEEDIFDKDKLSHATMALFTELDKDLQDFRKKYKFSKKFPKNVQYFHRVKLAREFGKQILLVVKSEKLLTNLVTKYRDLFSVYEGNYSYLDKVNVVSESKLLRIYQSVNFDKFELTFYGTTNGHLTVKNIMKHQYQKFKTKMTNIYLCNESGGIDDVFIFGIFEKRGYEINFIK